VRDDEPQVRVPVRHLGQDQPQRRGGVLEGRPDQPGQVVAGQPGSGLLADRMHEHDGPAPVQLSEYRVQRRVVELMPGYAAAHGEAGHGRETSDTGDLGQRLVNVRQRQGREGQEPPVIRRVQSGVKVVADLRGLSRAARIGQVGLRLRHRQYLRVDARLVKQREALADALASAAARTGGRPGRPISSRYRAG